MVICGQEFEFSILNANDMDRFEDANEQMQQAGRAETERFNLGAGASDRLGLDENNAAPIYDVLDAINEACKAEKQHYADRIPKPQPMNRAQRRAEKKARQRTQTAGHIVSQQPVSFPAQPPAAQMVERVDKAARRKALLAELAALEND